jgi:branched-chain amino acid transport system substrate-binding protein
MKLHAIGAAAVALLVSGMAAAQIKVGVITSATGPVASIGIPQKNAFSVMPSTLGGEPVTYTVLDDGGDPSAAGRLARKLITEDKVDLIIGPGSSPTASAVSFIASETKTPMIALSPVPGEQARNPWVFSISLPTPVGMKAVAEHIKAAGTKNIGYIGFADSWGDQVYGALTEHSATYGYRVTSNERYARLDTSANSQALKVIATHPDAVFVGGGGTQGALPQMALVERGYKGQVYHTGAVVNPEFLRVGGKALEGGLVYAGPFAVVDQLPDSNPSKKPGLEFAKAYETKFGAGSRNTFAAYSWDAVIVADKAASAAKAKAKAGTPEFRASLRDAIEATKEVAGSQGVYTMSTTDHSGNDLRSVVLLRIADGAWRLAK